MHTSKSSFPSRELASPSPHGPCTSLRRSVELFAIRSIFSFGSHSDFVLVTRTPILPARFHHFGPRVRGRLRPSPILPTAPPTPQRVALLLDERKSSSLSRGKVDGDDRGKANDAMFSMCFSRFVIPSPARQGPSPEFALLPPAGHFWQHGGVDDDRRGLSPPRRHLMSETSPLRCRSESAS